MVALLEKTLMITAFVAAMMLIIEYFNVLTHGLFLQAIRGSRPKQYLVAALLGAIPGCLGAFVAVALFAHRKISLGALVATMIATSGDETFVMLALFPGTTVLMTAGLAAIGVVAGWLTDTWIPAGLVPEVRDDCCGLEIHEAELPRGLSLRTVVSQWRDMSPYRATLMVSLSLVILAIVVGRIGPMTWGWKRITLLIVMSAGLFIVSTVPDHFLEKHLWRHVAKNHVPRIFLWTGGAIAVITGLMYFINLKAFVADNPWVTMVTASLVGLLPESGPHLLFVTMFSDKIAPLSVLVASSIVQDGHGMLPLLSTSKKAFIVIKLVNLVVGLAVGSLMLAVGF